MAVTPQNIEDAKRALAVVEEAIDFKALRDTMRQLIRDVEKDEDAMFGQERVATEFFKPESDFEETRNKVVKTSTVIVALNLIAAQFIVKTWPGYLKTKIEEWIISKVAGVTAATAALGIAIKAGKAAISRVLGFIVGAFTTTFVQEAEMRVLEKRIRNPATAVRRELNEAALSQAKKSSKVGEVSTRNG